MQKKNPEDVSSVGADGSGALELQLCDVSAWLENLEPPVLRSTDVFLLQALRPALQQEPFALAWLRIFHVKIALVHLLSRSGILLT